MILAIDAGNSRTKWGVFDEAGELKAHGAFLNAELDKVDTPVAWRSCGRVVVSNVAGKDVGNLLEHLLQPLAASITWASASSQACGVKNSYGTPEHLGTDRWAALLAAWQHYHAPCVVVNSGTALTIDALGFDTWDLDTEANIGVFLGGMILPGFGLMQQSLTQGTADIAARLRNEPQDSWQDFPTHTNAALYTGALSAMAGAIEAMYGRLQQHEGRPPYCVLTGGDAALLADTLHGDIAKHLVIADNLVLQGLLLIEREIS
jgi:type III pantothenate kinase